jgi:hypothetical protein
MIAATDVIGESSAAAYARAVAWVSAPDEQADQVSDHDPS